MWSLQYSKKHKTCEEYKKENKYVAYLPLIIHKASIHSFEVQVLCNICVDKNTD